MNKPLIYIIVGFFICAGLASQFITPTKIVVPEDPLAEEALNLIKAHPARQSPSIDMAIQEIAKDLKNRGKFVHLGEWRVAKEAEGTYMVSILIKEQGTTEWIERDYAWRVDTRDKSLRIVTLPATHIMPFHELPPMPMAPEHQ
ncbi:MAG: hypothetical protein O7F12_03545 [Nitrospirae bacterium]|nr:hypothetical protein [Nitrospirota bacterium]